MDKCKCSKSVNANDTINNVEEYSKSNDFQINCQENTKISLQRKVKKLPLKNLENTKKFSKNKCCCQDNFQHREDKNIIKKECSCKNNVSLTVNRTVEKEVNSQNKKCSCQNKINLTLDKDIYIENQEAQHKKHNKFVDLILKHKFISFLIVFTFFVSISILISYLVAGVIGIKTLGKIVSDQILGMKWLNELFGKFFLAIFGSEFMATKWGGVIQFFFYDVVKIFILLSTMIFVITYVQSYFPPKRTRELLGQKKGIFANMLGALLGTVTPFCSCSSIPIFIGFTSAGVNTGVAFSFLISSPLVDLGALILLASVFGFPIAISYVVVGLFLAVLGGTLIDKLGANRHIKGQDYFEDNQIILSLSIKDRLKYACYGVKNTIKKVWLFILIGVGLGATIHNFIPTEWINQVLGEDKWYSVLVATLIGAPIYADIFGVIPIAEALYIKGVGIGTILSFMMSVTALSLPSLIMLSKVIKPKIMIVFVLTVIAGIILIGYIFNYIGFIFVK